MGILSALANVIVPVLLVAGVGFALARFFSLDPGTISKLSLHALVPAMVLHSLLTTEVSGAVGVRLILGYLAASVLGAALAALLAGSVGTPTRRAMMLSVAVPNSGNMGLPIALFALGQAGFEQSVLLFLVSMILGFVLGPLLLGSSGGARAALIGLLKLPVIWAVLAGFALRLAGVQLPTGVLRGVEMLASATLPLVLLALGIQLGGSRRVRLTRAVLVGSGVRVLVMPALSLGAGLLFGLSGIPLQALVLSGAMPTAVNAFLLVLEYQGDVRTVADTVTVTTALSFPVAALVTAGLGYLG